MKIHINEHKIGTKWPVYFVAEISANHNQDFDNTVKLLEIAKNCGVNAVKVQTYTPDTLTINNNSEYFQCRKDSPWAGRTLYELYSQAYMPWEWQPKLKEIADDIGLDFFSTAFDPSAVDFLEQLEVPVHKIASFEITDIPLIRKMASTGKPIIISTGMATLGEIEEAVWEARQAGANEIALLKCTSSYPAKPEDMNLRTIPHLSEAFDTPVGLSDHTLGMTVPVAAVALGACIVEKHFTLSRSLPGPDSSFSLEPEELKQMVEAVRTAEKALGQVHYGVSESEINARKNRRSLFAVKDLKAGEVLTEENVRSIRPGHGLHPRHLPDILGRQAACDIKKGTPIDWFLIS